MLLRLPGARLCWRVERVDFALRVQGEIEDLTGQDRAVSVAFALPVAPEGLVWWDDVRNKRAVQRGQEYANLRNNRAGARREHSFYPIALVSKSAEHGIAVATRLDKPTVSRLLYDGGAERLCVSFDFGLTAQCKRFPSKAPFEFYIFDGGGDFRTASARYAALFPSFFVKRPMKEGIWMPFTDIAKVEGPEDFGFMYQEGAPNPEFDDTLGVYSFPYIEPMSWWMPMPKDIPRTYTAAIEYVDTYKKSDSSFQQACALALDSCGIRGPDGTLYMDFRNEPWCDGAQFTYNIDPELPTEEGVKNRAHINYTPQEAEKKFGPRGQKPRTEPGPGIDGMYLDSIEGWGYFVNCNTKHFDYVDTPLTFEAASKRPGILQWFSTWEFVKWIAEDLHSRGRLLMANWVYHSTPWLAPYLDVPGTEIVWLRDGKYQPQSDATLNSFRWMAWQRPYLLLNNVDFYKFDRQMMDLYFRRSLFYGMYPSCFNSSVYDAKTDKWSTLRYWHEPDLYNRDRELFVRFIPIIRQVASAGWQVLTEAGCDDDTIWVERFGDAAGGNLHFTIFNSSQSKREAKVRIAARKLGLKRADCVALDLVTGLDVPLQWQGKNVVLTVTLSGQDCAAVHIGRHAEVAAGCVELAAEALGRQRTASCSVRLPGTGSEKSMNGRQWAEYLNTEADKMRSGGAGAEQWAEKLSALAEKVGDLQVAGDASPQQRQRLERDIRIARSYLQRARMILQGLKLYARLEGDPMPGAEVAWVISLTNAGNKATDPVGLVLGSEQQGAGEVKYEPLGPGESRKVRISMALPAGTPTGRQVSDTLIVSSQVGDRQLATMAHLQTFTSEAASVKLTADSASLRDTERTLKVEVQNLSSKAQRARVHLTVPAGWQLRPEEKVVEAGALQTGACEFTVIIPPDAEARAYPVRARLILQKGVGGERESEPVNVFYFGHPEFEKWDNLAVRATVTTDSNYRAYDPHPLNDGVTLPPAGTHWTDAAWASEDVPADHWIEIDLGKPQTIDRVVIVWPVDNGQLYVSRTFQVQVYDEAEAGWITVAQVDANPETFYTVLKILPTRARRWRIFQPSGGGPMQRPNIMWVAEVGLYAAETSKGKEQQG